MKLVNCAYCAHPIHAVRAFQDDADPKPGDVVFCGECYERSEFQMKGGKLILGHLTDATRKELNNSEWHELMYSVAVAMAKTLKEAGKPV